MGNDEGSAFSEKRIDRLTVGAKIDVYDVFEEMSRWSISNGIPRKKVIKEAVEFRATIRDTTLLEELNDIRDWLSLQTIWYVERRGQFTFKSREDRNKFILRWQG